MSGDNELRSLLDNPAVSGEHRRALAALEPDVHFADATPELSPAAAAMLARFKKSRLSEITEQEWEQYVRERHVDWKDPLVKEVRDWLPAGPDMLDLLGMSLADWWQAILQYATTADVRANAAAQLRKLE